MKAIRAILGVAFIVAVLWSVAVLVPPYYHNYELQDTIADEARMNTYTPKSVEEMRETIFRRCQNLEIPCDREKIVVSREQGGVMINVNYSVHVELPGYPMDLQFNPSSKNRQY